MTDLAEFVRTTPFFIIAHRGASAVAPENTLASIQKAIDSGVAMIEIDVQRTADHSLVVFHDLILGRTTNGHGYVKNSTVNELRELDAGSWFDARCSGEKIPLVHEVLDVIEGRAYLNVEIKPLGEDPQSLATAIDLVHELDQRSYLPLSVISSFDHSILADLKKIFSHLHTCALHVPHDARLPSEIVAACSADAYGCSIRELTHRRAENCKVNNIPFGVYAVNTIEQLTIARGHGVNAVVSNNPSALQIST